MNLGEIIGMVDAIKPNRFERSQKIRWISELESTMYREVVLTHEGGEGIRFTGYDESTPDTTPLIVQEPYSMVYRWYLEAQMDLANGELGKYQNSMALYNSAYTSFLDGYNRQHPPIQHLKAFRI